jgi:hypothetical protein
VNIRHIQDLIASFVSFHHSRTSLHLRHYLKESFNMNTATFPFVYNPFRYAAAAAWSELSSDQARSWYRETAIDLALASLVNFATALIWSYEQGQRFRSTVNFTWSVIQGWRDRTPFVPMLMPVRIAGYLSAAAPASAVSTSVIALNASTPSSTDAGCLDAISVVEVKPMQIPQNPTVIHEGAIAEDVTFDSGLTLDVLHKDRDQVAQPQSDSGIAESDRAIAADHNVESTVPPNVEPTIVPASKAPRPRRQQQPKSETTPCRSKRKSKTKSAQ